MVGIVTPGTAAAGTRGLAGGSSAFLELLQSNSSVGRYILEVALTPLNVAFATPRPHTYGTKAAGTRSLYSLGGADPLVEGRILSFSDGEYKTSPTDRVRPNFWAEVRILGRADVERSARVSQAAGSRAQVTIGEVEINDADGYLRDILADYSIKGQVGEIRYVPENGEWSDGQTVFRAFVAGVTRREGVARILFKDVASVADAPLNLYRYGGGGRADGGADLQGTYRSWALGEVRNVKPLLEDAGVWIYRFSNSLHSQIDEVTDSGLPLIKDGTFSGSYEQLRGEALAEGHWIDAPGLGCFKANFAGGSPAGEVRCSGKGDATQEGYVQYLGPCALRVLDMVGVDRTLLDVSSFSSLPNYKMGYWFGGGDTPPNGEEVLKQICDPVLGIYGSLYDERFAIGRLQPPEDLVYAIEFEEPEIVSVEEVLLDQPPIYRQRMLYDRNWDPLDPSDLGGGLTEEQQEALTLRNPAAAEAFRGETLLQNRDAEEGVFYDTLLIEEADAVAACQLHIDMWGPGRRAFEITVNRRGLQASQATTGRLTHRELPNGISAATDVSIVGRRDNYGDNQIRLKVLA